jgi:hypothetical protein
MAFVYFLLVLLAGCALLGFIRVLKGQPFLPDSPDGDRVFQDRKGRWWREADGGTLEDAFRKPGGTPSRFAQAALGFAGAYLDLSAWFVVLAGVVLCIGAIASVAIDAGVPQWLLWLIGIAAYFLIFRFGRKRGWY